jgi:site-specific recombinase XerC
METLSTKPHARTSRRSVSKLGWTAPRSQRIRATQQLLGHEDIGTTANIYVQPNEASLERKLAEIYESGDADNDSARPR